MIGVRRFPQCRLHRSIGGLNPQMSAVAGISRYAEVEMPTAARIWWLEPLDGLLQPASEREAA